MGNQQNKQGYQLSSSSELSPSGPSGDVDRWQRESDVAARDDRASALESKAYRTKPRSRDMAAVKAAHWKRYNDIGVKGSEADAAAVTPGPQPASAHTSHSSTHSSASPSSSAAQANSGSNSGQMDEVRQMRLMTLQSKQTRKQEKKDDDKQTRWQTYSSMQSPSNASTTPSTPAPSAASSSSSTASSIPPAISTSTDPFDEQMQYLLAKAAAMPLASVQLLRKILQNVLKFSPTDPSAANAVSHDEQLKYRKIKLNNNKIQQLIIDVDGALEVLNAVGFTTREFMSTQQLGQAEVFLYLDFDTPLDICQIAYMELSKLTGES